MVGWTRVTPRTSARVAKPPPRLLDQAHVPNLETQRRHRSGATTADVVGDGELFLEDRPPFVHLLDREVDEQLHARSTSTILGHLARGVELDRWCGGLRGRRHAGPPLWLGLRTPGHGRPGSGTGRGCGLGLVPDRLLELLRDRKRRLRLGLDLGLRLGHRGRRFWLFRTGRGLRRAGRAGRGRRRLRSIVLRVGGQKVAGARALVETPGWVFSEVHHPDQILVGPPTHAPNESVDTVGGVLEVVLSEAFRQRQVHEEDLSELHVPGQRKARTALGHVLDGHQLLPGAAVAQIALHPGGYGKAQPCALAALPVNRHR